MRGKGEELHPMAAEYRTPRTKPNATSELVQHCENLVERYTQAVEDAEALAQVHAKHPLSGPGKSQPPENLVVGRFELS